MFMSLALGANARYAKIRDGVEELAEQKASDFFKSSRFLQAVAEIKDVINAKLAAFAEGVLNLFPGKKTPKIKKPRKSYREVIHHEDLNFSEHTRQKFADDKVDGEKSAAENNSDDTAFVDGDEKVSAIEKISIGGEKISVKRVQLNKSSDDDAPEKTPLIDWDGVTKLDDEKFLDGFKLGIGLAFLSMALNGLTDHLLFNIPSAILMWQLGALAAAINSMRNA